MKKVLSTLLAVCLVLTAIPVVRSGAVGNELLREDFENAVLETYNAHVNVLKEKIAEDDSKWYVTQTDDGWFAPTLENGALSISKKGRITKKIAEAGAMAKGETYIVSFKAKNTGAGQTLYFCLCNVSKTGAEWNSRTDQGIWKSDVYQNYSVAITLNESSYPDNECFVFSIYNPSAAAGTVQIDDLRVRKQQPATNSGLIMDGDFEATEQLTAYSNGTINNLTNGKWYASNTDAVSVKSDEEHGNYAVLSANKGGRLVQNLPAAKLDESVVITFKARSADASKLMYFYVVPSAAINGYGGRVCRNIATEWTEYTMIFNPMGTEADSNVQIDPLGSGDYSGQNVIFEIYNPAGNGCDLEIDDIRIEKADPFASNDLGQAELTGVSMRGANGSLPTAIRWKNAITKTFAENGVGGFTVVEYGALVANTSTLEANNEKLTENAKSAKIKGVAYNATTSKLFAETEEYNIFSLALSGITTENYGKALTVRPYVKISNDQKIITVYGESRSNSLFDACHAVLSGTDETDIALVKGILTETDDVKQAYLEEYPGDSEKLQ